MANAWIIPSLPIAAATGAAAIGYSAAYVANDHAGVVWKSPAGASADLLIDLGSDQTVDTIMLLGCDGATAAMTLQVFWATAAAGSGFNPGTGADTARPFLAGAVMPTSGRGVGLWQAPSALPACRYWLLRIGGLAGGAASIARVVIGRRIQLERNFSYGAAFGVRDLGSLDFSPRGVLLRRRGKKLRTLGLTFSSVRKDEMEASVQPLLERIGNTEMVGLITDPAPDAQRQNRCYFGPLVGDLGTTRRNAAVYEAKANLVSLF